VAWIKTNLARGEKVTGIVVCGGHDKKLEYAIETLKDCFIAHYDVKFTITLAKSMIGS